MIVGGGEQSGNGNTVALILKILGFLLTAGIVVATAASGYSTIAGRLDRLDDRMTTQGKQLEALASSIKTLAEDALTSSDLRAACLEMSIANKGWRCPFVSVEVRPPRRSSPSKAAVVETWSLFGSKQ
jgi:hypothetical protein